MSASKEICIRRADRGDLQALTRLSTMLVRVHRNFDSDRFPAVEEEYASFLSTQLGQPSAVIYVAEQEGVVVGYVYAALEPRSWKDLRDAAGFIHDVVVDEAARGRGIAARLTEMASAWLEDQGAPRVVLGTAARNEPAQRLFERLGFRRTMIEMTRERR